jgi:LmbE family N-acetylglucosaminyl deacetylase
VSVLVVAAHPDDEVLGAGGTLAAHARSGVEVHAVILSDGAGSRYGDGMAERLAAAARRAAQEIGFASLRFQGLEDQRLDTVPLIEITQRLEAVVGEVQPDTVYAHFPGDANIDHQVAARATWTACRPYRFPCVRTFAVFETPSSTEWGWPLAGSPFQPNLYVDVAGTLDTKLRAMACYETELREYPHPRSERALRERAAYWGSRVGRAAAEPFCLLREVR